MKRYLLEAVLCVFAFLQKNIAESQISQVDNGRAEIRLDQTKKQVKLWKAIFHDKLSELIKNMNICI